MSQNKPYDEDAAPADGPDIRVAAAGARLGLSEVKWGLFPMAGSTLRFPRQVPF